MAEAQSWLPREALNDPRLGKSLSEIIDAWASHWFAIDAPKLADLRLDPKEPTFGGGDRHWQNMEPGVDFSIPAQGAERMVELALDLDAKSEQAALKDNPVLQSFHAMLLADLTKRLSREARDREPCSDQRPDGAIFQVRTSSNETLLSVRLSRAYLITLRKTFAPASSRRPLSSRLSDGVKDASVRVEVRVGTASLSLSDVRNLARGDVVPLNARIADGVTLHIPNDTHAFARATMRETSGRLGLEISQTDKTT